MRSSQVSPFWADLVCASTKLHVYTERQIDTWQSLPELTPEISDFTSEQTEIPNVELGTSTNKAPASSLEGSEGVLDASTSKHTSMLQVVSFKDQNASANNNPQPNEWAMPESVDLHKNGLRRSSLLAALHLNETIAAHSTLPTKYIPFKAACLRSSVYSVHMVWEQWHWCTLIKRLPRKCLPYLLLLSTVFIESILFMMAQ